jgi:hypothetical protein
MRSSSSLLRLLRRQHIHGVWMNFDLESFCGEAGRQFREVGRDHHEIGVQGMHGFHGTVGGHAADQAAVVNSKASVAATTSPWLTCTSAGENAAVNQEDEVPPALSRAKAWASERSEQTLLVRLSLVHRCAMPAERVGFSELPADHPMARTHRRAHQTDGALHLTATEQTSRPRRCRRVYKPARHPFR